MFCLVHGCRLTVSWSITTWQAMVKLARVGMLTGLTSIKATQNNHIIGNWVIFVKLA